MSSRRCLTAKSNQRHETQLVEKCLHILVLQRYRWAQVSVSSGSENRCEQREKLTLNNAQLSNIEKWFSKTQSEGPCRNFSNNSGQFITWTPRYCRAIKHSSPAISFSLTNASSSSKCFCSASFSWVLSREAIDPTATNQKWRGINTNVKLGKNDLLP